VFQLERGAIPSPHAATLHRLATALEIPIAWLNPDEPPLLPGASSPTVDSSSPATEFDRQTNPYVDVVHQQFPQAFAGFTPDDWNELYSSFGTGGALTEEGVLQLALALSQKRETLRRVSLLLETHLAAPTTAMVNSLFQLIQVPPATAEAGAPAAD
jgi:transcriptional regulator with XRE-family HTH domain